MPYPGQTFPNFDALLNYINTEWISNGDGNITGVIGNNVVNGLLTFITQSPLNYQMAGIISTGGVVVTTKPVTVIKGVVPTSINWSDNIYNQNIIINATNSPIPLPSGVFYYNAALQPQSIIQAVSVVNIVKASNGLWIQTNQGGNAIIKPPIAGAVGGTGMPAAGSPTYTNPRLVGLGSLNGGNVEFSMAGSILYNYGNNSTFELDNVNGIITLLFGNEFQAGDPININTNQ